MDQIEHIRNHFGLGNIILAEGLNRYLDEIVKNADIIIEKEKKDQEDGKYSWVSMEALVRDAKAIQNYLDSNS